MTARPQPAQALTLAGILAVFGLSAWGWHQAVVRSKPGRLPAESWEHVKQQYPLPDELGITDGLPVESAQAVVQANPFSQQRHPPVELGGQAGTAPPTPPPAAFVFKGRVTIGSRERAIMEETASKKTYFLQVGQTVAGFKVLDIGQKSVLLSNLTTKEELVVAIASGKP